MLEDVFRGGVEEWLQGCQVGAILHDALQSPFTLGVKGVNNKLAHRPVMTIIDGREYIYRRAAE